MIPKRPRMTSDDLFIKAIMLKHRALVAEFLQTNYDKFFKHYADLLQTKNYATLRQALKLLSELLLGSLGISMKIFEF